MRTCWLPLILVAAAATGLAAAPRTLVAWEFDKAGDLEGWRPNGAHMADLKTADGVLSGAAVDWDPFVISPLFDIPARHSQWIETRIRASHGGRAEIFWSGTLKSQYGGFSPGKSTPLQLVGDGKWHVYRLRPGWEPEKKIIHLRLDFPAASAGKRDAVAVDYLRIMQPEETPSAAEPSWDFAAGAGGWSLEDPDAGRMAAADGALAVRSTTRPARIVSPSVKFPAEQRFFVSLRLTADKGQTATLGFATDAQAGFHVRNFPIRADGLPHGYLLDLSAERQWRGHIRLLTLEPTDAAEASARIHSLRVTNEPKGQPEVVLRAFGLADGLARAGHPLALTASFANVGSAPAGSVEATLALPRGLTAKGPSTQRLDGLWYGETRTLEWNVTATQPLRGTVKISVSADGQKPFAQTTAVAIGPSLRLPKHDYVPVPKPAKTDYSVGVYYFPGWHTWSRWRPILDYPERKPLLGWYDEAKPEVADWQIKWAVEHGISFFAVDWYWCQGARHLEHWLHDAYFKARYRRLLKFCLLWANHNPPDTSSEADLLKVTDYWLAHYFKRPEHLTVEGKPVMIIFSTYRFTKDMGTPALAASFMKMRQRCKAAGLPGLYLVACTQADRRTIEQLKAQGYDAVSGYNYPSLGAGGRKRASFEALVPEYKKLWNAAADHKLLKEIPVLSGGWDSRPWHHQKALVRYGRTPALFEQHCRDANQFLDTRDAEMPPRLRMCLIEAWNEWGEGSYIGPHAEHGFGYLEAVRKVFAPTSPKPLEVIPRDIGLGPYDLPRPTSRVQHAWDFARAADRADWHLSSQIDRKPSDTSLHGVATGRDPVINGPTMRLPARQVRWLRLEARASRPAAAQLFWATTTAPVSENNSIRFDLPGDGRWHTLWVDLRQRPYWAGLVLGLRFDPVGQAGTEFELRSLRFAADRAR